MCYEAEKILLALAYFNNKPYLCIAFEGKTFRVLWEQGVVGSNPATPTGNGQRLFHNSSVRGVAQSG